MRTVTQIRSHHKKKLRLARRAAAAAAAKSVSALGAGGGDGTGDFPIQANVTADDTPLDNGDRKTGSAERKEEGGEEVSSRRLSICKT